MIKKILVSLFLLVPSSVFAAPFAVPFQATSTTQGWIFPSRVNGTDQTIVSKNYIATSSTGNAFLAPSGSISSPSYSFTNKTDTGIWLNSNSMTFSQSGVAKFTTDGNANTRFANGIEFASAYNQGSDIFVTRQAANVLGITGTGSTGSTISVGISTTSPWGQLSVNPNGITGPEFVIGSSTKTDFIVTNAGNVGIGTTTPSTLLHLSSNSSGNALAYFDNFNATPDNGIVFRSARGTVASPTAIQANDAIFQILGRGYAATGFSTGSKVAIQGFASQAWTASNQGTYLTFNTTANNSTTLNERMRIDDAGNVGIGTTSPTARLSVDGGTGIAEVLRRDDATASVTNGTLSILQLQNLNTTANNASAIGFVTNDASGLQLTAAQIAAQFTSHTAGAVSSDLVFITDNSGTFSEKARITSVGKLQLTYPGTTPAFRSGDSGTAMLHISSNPSGVDGSALTAVFQRNTTNTNSMVSGAVLQVNSTGTAAADLGVRFRFDAKGSDGSIRAIAGFGAALENTTDAGYLVFQTCATGCADAPAERLRITSTGNVGIGTSTPNNLLSVSSSGATPIELYRTVTGNTNIKFWNPTAAMYAGLNGNGDFGISNNVNFASAPYFVVASSTGNVGVATSTPSQKLDVNGNINLEGAGNGIIIHDSITANCYLINTVSGVITATLHACQ